MKKLLIIMSLMLLSLTVMADTYLEDHIEDTLEAQYNYITDGNNNTIELDIDVREQGKNITVIITVDDDSYNVKKSFNKKTFDNYVKKIERTAKKEANGKNVIIKSYY